MEHPRKRVKSQAPNRSGPERKTHTTRRRKLQRSSLDYASSRDEKDYRPAYDQNRPPKKPKKASVIVPRPNKENQNLRDPFNVLDDDAVFLIVEQLSARETEILRRVSKLWKASSEAHCGRNALKKHFPLAAAKVEGCGSRKEENLRFRRHLHYHESLAIGNATRAVRCVGALDWHLERDTLVWSNKKGDLSIRALRSRSDNLPVTSATTSIDFCSFEIPFASINSVQLTEGNDLIVDLLRHGSGDRSPVWLHGQKLMKLTRQGAVVWEMDFISSISVPAVGKNAIFFVERYLNPTSSESIVSFVKLSLQDGSLSYRIQLPDRYRQVRPNESDKHLRLFSDEAFAIWRDSANSAYLFSTKTGQVLKVYPRTTRTSPIVCRESSFIWDINSNLQNPPLNIYSSWPEFSSWPGSARSFSQLVTVQEAPPAVKFEAILFPTSSYPHSGWRFSGDRCVFFYFTHVVLPNVAFDRRLLGQIEPTDPDTGVWVSVMEKTPSEQSDMFWLKEHAPAVQISLPSRSETLGERRPLELDLPWKVKDDDYLGMVNDYMVYHCPEEEILLLVDFWPNW